MSTHADCQLELCSMLLLAFWHPLFDLWLFISVHVVPRVSMNCALKSVRPSNDLCPTVITRWAVSLPPHERRLRRPLPAHAGWEGQLHVPRRTSAAGWQQMRVWVHLGASAGSGRLWETAEQHRLWSHFTVGWLSPACLCIMSRLPPPAHTG